MDVPPGWLRTFYRCLFYFLLIPPPLAWLEQLLRGPTHVLWGRDLLLENLAGYGFAALYHVALGAVKIAALSLKNIVFLPLTLLRYGWISLFVALALIVLLVWLKRKKRLRLPAKGLSRTISYGLFFITYFGLSTIWWMLAAWQTELAALLGLALLIAVHLREQIKYVGMYLWIFLWMMLPLFLLADFAQHLTARPVMVERLRDGACYDVACNERDECGLTPAETKQAEMFIAGSWQALTQTGGPQRLAVEPHGSRFFFANYHAGENALLIHSPGRDRVAAIPGCDNAIDVNYSAPRQTVTLACEAGRSVQRYEPDGGVVRALAHTRGFPYALAASTTRLFVTQEFFVGKLGEVVPGGGRVTAVDLNTGAVSKERRFGLIVWGATWEENRRLLWVAKPLTGEVLALDEELNILARIRVDYGPRDLAYDPGRDRVLAGNYLTGTISVIDAATKKKLIEIRPGKPFSAGQLRGVHVSPRGDQYLCNGKGLLRLIRKDEPL